MTTPGHILRKYRQDLGKSTKEFADVLEIAEVTLRSLENGNRTITGEVAKKIEEKTGGGLIRHDLCPELFGDLPRPRRARRIPARSAA